jgi:hypothetical protein
VGAQKQGRRGSPSAPMRALRNHVRPAPLVFRVFGTTGVGERALRPRGRGERGGEAHLTIGRGQVSELDQRHRIRFPDQASTQRLMSETLKPSDGWADVDPRAPHRTAASKFGPMRRVVSTRLDGCAR